MKLRLYVYMCFGEGRYVWVGNDREIIIAVGVGTLEANTRCGRGQFNVLLRVCSETCTTAGGAT
jgi:hypothetical protein